MRQRARIGAALAFALSAAAAAAQAPDAKALMDEFLGRSPPQTRDAKALEAAFGTVLDALMPGLAAEKIPDREADQQALEKIAHRAGGPGSEPLRAALCSAIAARLGPATPAAARIWLLRKVETIGGPELTGALAPLLADTDAQVRETARRALQASPDERASDALRAALESATERSWRIALVQALAARRDAASAAAFEKLASDPDVDVALAAISALGVMGQGQATLERLAQSAAAPLNQAAGEALVRLAEGRWADGQTDTARDMFSKVYSSSLPWTTRAAAVHGLTLAAPREAIPILLAALRGQRDADLAAQARGWLAEMPGPDATDAIAAALDGASPALQVQLIDLLGRRGGAAARAAVVQRLSDPSVEVRIACLRALATLGTADDVPALASAAAAATAAVADAARDALQTLPGESVDAALRSAAVRSEAAIRAALIPVLVERGTRDTAELFFDATQHADPAVRLAGIRALEKTAQPEHLLSLLGVLIAAPDDGTRIACEDALAALLLRQTDREPHVQALMGSLATQAGATRVALLRILGRVQGATALSAVRASLRDADADVADAAVRAYAQWRDPGQAGELLALAGTWADAPQRVLMLRGAVRLLQEDAKRPPDELAKLLGQALGLCAQDEDRKLVLGALAKVAHPDALALALPLVEQPAVRDEAGLAAAGIAKSLAGLQPAESRRTLEALAARTDSEPTRKAAQAALEDMKKYAGCVTQWVYAGPYSISGKNHFELLTTPLPPESPDSSGVAWKPLTTTRPDLPWVFDFVPIDSGSERCLYARTRVLAANDTPVRIELGSDDCVRVWLNGALIHEESRVRPVTPGQDKVDATLRAGWNTLLVKVTQGSGGWGLCLAIRSPTGEPIEGLQIEAK